MPVFDPFINPIKETLSSTIKPSNIRTHLYDYILNRLGVGPTTERFGVPTPTKPYIGIDGKPVTGNYVGMDTSPGNVGRNIDLENVSSQASGSHVGLNPDTQQVVTHDGQEYIIGKDQKLIGNKVYGKDVPTIGEWKGRVGKGLIDLVTGNKWDLDKRSTPSTLITDAQKTREKTATDRLLDQEKVQTAIHQSKQPMYDDMHRRNLDLINQVGEQQMARDLNWLKQSYPLQQAAAWDATKRWLYGDKYSASAAQRRFGESAAAEAQMLAGIASQANAAANMRGRYAGKNISIG